MRDVTEVLLRRYPAHRPREHKKGCPRACHSSANRHRDLDRGPFGSSARHACPSVSQAVFCLWLIRLCLFHQRSDGEVVQLAKTPDIGSAQKTSSDWGNDRVRGRTRGLFEGKYRLPRFAYPPLTPRPIYCYNSRSDC